jgi:hypothetical protein
MLGQRDAVREIGLQRLGLQTSKPCAANGIASIEAARKENPLPTYPLGKHVKSCPLVQSDFSGPVPGVVSVKLCQFNNRLRPTKALPTRVYSALSIRRWC